MFVSFFGLDEDILEVVNLSILIQCSQIQKEEEIWTWATPLDVEQFKWQFAKNGNVCIKIKRGKGSIIIVNNIFTT